MIALDAGRTCNGGRHATNIELYAQHQHPRIREGFTAAHHPRDPSEAMVHGPAPSVLGHLEDLGQFAGCPQLRADPEHFFPDGLTKQRWPADTFAQIGSGDYGSAYHERGEIYDLVRDSKITGFAIVSGDRHSLLSGYAASLLPPAKFEPVGISFVGASLASPGAMKLFEHGLPKDYPLRSLFLADRPTGDQTRERGANGPTTCSSSTASARASNTLRVST